MLINVHDGNSYITLYPENDNKQKRNSAKYFTRKRGTYNYLLHTVINYHILVSSPTVNL